LSPTAATRHPCTHILRTTSTNTMTLSTLLVSASLVVGAWSLPTNVLEERSSVSSTISALAAKQSSLQFVTAKCGSDCDCQQGCCAFKTATCAGPGIAQTRASSGGCGFGGSKPNCDVAKALNLGVCVKGGTSSNSKTQKVQQAAAFVSLLDKLPFTPAAGISAGSSSGSKTTTTKKETESEKASSSNNEASDESASKTISALAASQSSLQFVTGSCKKDGQCQQGCCAFLTGQCAGPGIAQTRASSGGCGFGNKTPNCDVATALNLGVCVKGGNGNNAKTSAVQKAAAFVSILDKLPFTPV